MPGRFEFGAIGYTIGAAAAIIAGGVATLLITALVVYWIITYTGLATLTYAQVAGLLAIWNIIKPHTESK